MTQSRMCSLREVDPLRHTERVWWALGMACLAQRGDMSQMEGCFFVSAPIQEASQVGVLGFPNSDEHSDVTQKWNWDVCEDGN